MPNYKEADIAGTKWQRAVRVVVENPYEGTPSITFVEEEAINTGSEVSEVVTRVVGNLSCQFNPESEFPVLNPVNNQSMGYDFSHGQVYALLYSLYMHLASQRDS